MWPGGHHGWGPGQEADAYAKWPGGKLALIPVECPGPQVSDINGMWFGGHWNRDKACWWFQMLEIDSACGGGQVCWSESAQVWPGHHVREIWTSWVGPQPLDMSYV